MTDPANSPDPAAEMRFLTRGVTPHEAAALSAVLHGLMREENDSLRQAPARGQSAWQRSQRGIRTPMVPGDGRWRGFSA
ncbi:hypothetical protein E3T26_03480 [Cryobacterium sp. TMT1-21]|uniref:Acyl-CoA carboxylase subunit epsilon n=1 Tax=Cryobacterium shii TaxID=1259235 RepID=A0AAQ2C5A3_9MICO|nr:MULTISPECIES: acyl-CoA carboxylase epsilon subunit [Cryobacterium]TFC44970.1 hypothetical protein E3O49_11075 [Cryobacterium shii]TFC89649.1 hypothetical protein E3T24_00665 [Cryobacterium sp. TmT2-59]TFD11965.1 hypothetical protein E3T42_15500 [Cryobacterium sp. TMT4-10]TFD16893.1 hypothetical protein E3T26_03480 [Cryobacterium sp. TMT1-21]TFD22851.1 hypothetical protein E3T32_05830 [Cryobacterium sp. TMT2-23]